MKIRTKQTDGKEIENEKPKDDRKSIPEFTEQEVQADIDCLKK